MKKAYLLFVLCFFPVFSMALVDTRSAGYSKTFLDFKAQNSSSLMEIKRTYNSRSIYNGLFGFGWCSPIETQLSVLPDETIKIVECGAGMQILYHPKGKVPKVDFYVNRILQELKKRKVKLSPRKLAQLKKDLLASENLRSNFIDTLNIRGSASKGLKYYGKGRSKEYIIVTSTGYKRRLPNGFEERYNKEGRLVESKTPNGKIDLTWTDKMLKIMDEKGNRLIYSLNNNGKIRQARYNKKVVGNYGYSGEDLRTTSNSFKETYNYKYDDLHNLVKTVYPNGKTEELKYDVKKDWVIGFKDRRGCRESYSYEVNARNSDHYFSTVQKICGKRIVNKSKYEFWHASKPGGGKYLKRAKSRINGRVNMDVTYHPVFGTPISMYKNGVRTKRDYYGNGFLKKKDNSFQTVEYKRYHKKCLKPELVEVAYKNPSNSSKIVRREKIIFNFDTECQLYLAKKSEDEWIKIGHNVQGQIVSMEDQSRKKITLKWNQKFNKPYLLKREGVGSVRIVYNNDGSSIVNLKGLSKDPTVITQVTSVFSSFLSTLGPVAEEMVIL